MKLLRKYKKQLKLIAEKLVEVETLSRKEFEKIFPPLVKKRIGGTHVLAKSRAKAK